MKVKKLTKRQELEKKQLVSRIKLLWGIKYPGVEIRFNKKSASWKFGDMSKIVKTSENITAEFVRELEILLHTHLEKTALDYFLHKIK